MDTTDAARPDVARPVGRTDGQSVEVWVVYLYRRQASAVCEAQNWRAELVARDPALAWAECDALPRSGEIVKVCREHKK